MSTLAWVQCIYTNSSAFPVKNVKNKHQYILAARCCWFQGRYKVNYMTPAVKAVVDLRERHLDFGRLNLMATHMSETANFLPTIDGVHYLQERLWQLILLTAFPNTCSLTSHEMSFAVLPVFDCVSTPSVVRLWHGTPGLPLLVIRVKLKMMSKMSSMSFFTARTLMWFVFAGDLRPYSQRQECRTYLPFCTRKNNKLNFFLLR